MTPDPADGQRAAGPRVLSVVGARPQFVKLAPVAKALTSAGVLHTIVHTGQHYDPAMSDVFFDELGIPAPDEHLDVGSGDHGAQTGAMLTRLEPVLQARRPDVVLVYGDTNSTLAATVAAVKLHLPVAHLEAGLRSFNRRMPEEHNRVLTDHAADLLLAPSRTAMDHLAAEGLADRSVLVGDVMTDVCLAVRDEVQRDPVEVPHGLEPGGFVVATLHRAENTDDPARLAALLEGMAGLPVPVLLLAHPRLVHRAEAAGLDLVRRSLRAAPPAPYRELVSLVLQSRGVVTDSGGLQKEAYLLRRPCTTLRTETEWVETLEDAANALVPDPAALAAAVGREVPATAFDREHYGDGHAAERVVRELVALVS